MIKIRCGKVIPTLAENQRASDAWYIAPILFGLIGGIIMWFCIKETDPKKAKKGMLVGVILTIPYIVAVVFLFTATWASMWWLF